MEFFLGTHEPSWVRRTDVPLFLSARRLRRLKSLPTAAGPWSLDSGGFTELNMYGRWVTQPGDYAREVRRWSAEVGQLRWAAIQDWMCEPFVLEKTRLTVGLHQSLTVRSWQSLNWFAPDLPWVPVLQGWEIDDYLRHRDLYSRCGTDLTTLPVVGLGSVCRRQGTRVAGELVRTLYREGFRNLHGFGMKTTGLLDYGPLLQSSDSLAWSYNARRRPPLPGCGHKSCANCLRWAVRWRSRLLARLDGSAGCQLTMC